MRGDQVSLTMFDAEVWIDDHHTSGCTSTRTGCPVRVPPEERPGSVCPVSTCSHAFAESRCISARGEERQQEKREYGDRSWGHLTLFHSGESDDDDDESLVTAARDDGSLTSRRVAKRDGDGDEDDVGSTGVRDDARERDYVCCRVRARV